MDIFQLVESCDYIDEFKKNKVVFRKYPNLNLMIVKRKFGSEYNEDKPWLNHCRGLVIDYVNNVVVFCPPIKSKEIVDFDDISSLTFDSVSELVDGTMINLFHFNGEWLMSTRSNIGCKNQWQSDISFKDMFDECSPNFEFSSLDNDYTYSFVMRHKKNRIIIPVEENELYLIEMRKKNIVSDLVESEYYKTNKLLAKDNLQKDISWNHSIFNVKYLYKGYSFMQGSTRYKWLTDDSKFIETIKPNTNNHLLNYLQLRKSGHLTNYLKYFPENRHIYDNFRHKVHDLTKQLQHYYRNVFIYKNIEKSDVPYVLKPFVHELHGIYLRDKQGISWEDVKMFIYNLEPKRICFALNNM